MSFSNEYVFQSIVFLKLILILLINIYLFFVSNNLMLDSILEVIIIILLFLLDLRSDWRHILVVRVELELLGWPYICIFLNLFIRQWRHNYLMFICC